MKKSRIISVLLVIITFLLICGSVGAYMRKQTSTIENVFVPAQVSCLVEEKREINMKKEITVKNTSTIDAYLRLRFVTYWVDDDGKILSKESQKLSVKHDNENWFVKDDIYYYMNPVKPGESTLNLLKENIVLTEKDGVRQVIEVFADAIQSLPKEAVESSWGVKVGSNGILSAN